MEERNKRRGGTQISKINKGDFLQYPITGTVKYEKVA
jgi:hypothetical protein